MIYVTLPEGDDEEGKRALLLKTMYRTQDTSHVWPQLDYTALLHDEKFEQGKTSVFAHKEQDIKLLVHGDDVFVLADLDGERLHAKVFAKSCKTYEFRSME